MSKQHLHRGHLRTVLATRKRRITAITAVLIIALSASAFAYFALSTGTSNFSVASQPTFSVVVGPPVGPALSPGSGTNTMTLDITNTTGHSETLTSVAFSVNADSAGGIYDTTSQSWQDSCLAAWFTIAGGDGGLPLPMTVTAGQSLPNGDVAVSMPADSQDVQNACQGLSPEITVTAS